MTKRATVLRTRPASGSLLDILRYIQADSPSAAQRLAEEIEAKTSRLGRFPISGRVVPKFPSSGLREILGGNYRIIYRLVKEKSRVEVLTVRHGARLLDERPEAKER